LTIGLAAPILVLNFWAIASISQYFGVLIAIGIVASLLAFLLNYPVGWFERHGLRRGPASIIVFLLAISILFGLGITLIPIAFNQAQQLAARLPDWIESGRQQLIVLSAQAEERGLPLDLDILTAQAVDRLQDQLQALTRGVLNLAVGTVSSLFDTLVDVLITVVLTFYLLQHGNELWDSLLDWLPGQIRQPFSQTLRLSFQNYFIGQLILGICMASVLIPIFLILKVPFGLLFGLTIGTMALVPFGGSVGIALVTLLVTLQNFWLGLKVLIAAVIVQQILENLVAPRILGSVTGLNPVWIFISILIGAKVGGLLGVVIAVPTAVVVKTALETVRSRIVVAAPEVEVLPASAANEPSTEDLSEVPQV
jgi:predicted PurR-regulated permease PerM